MNGGQKIVNKYKNSEYKLLIISIYREINCVLKYIQI